MRKEEELELGFELSKHGPIKDEGDG